MMKEILKSMLLQFVAILSFSFAYSIMMGAPETFVGNFKLVVASLLVVLGIAFSVRLARRR